MQTKKCVMWKRGRCCSMYAKGVYCDGLNPPKNCPYKSVKKGVEINKEVRAT